MHKARKAAASPALSHIVGQGQSGCQTSERSYSLICEVDIGYSTAEVENHMTSRLRTTLLFVAVVSVSLAIRAPLAVERVRLTPDSIAYYNIAHNLASVHGFTSTLKLGFNNASPVTHPALSDWPPIYPIFAALVLRCGGDERSLQFANALFVSIAAGLVFLIASRLFDWRAGLIAGAAAALAPNLFRAGIVPLSDALGLALALSALALAVAPRQTTTTCLCVGLLAGAATLTRYPNAVVAAALIVPGLLHRERRRNALICTLGFVCTVAPVVAALGSGAGQTQAVHYCVQSFHSALWNAGLRLDPYYAAHHPSSILAAALRHSAFYAWDLLIGLRGLFLLGAGLILAIDRRRLPTLSSEQNLILTAAALSFAVYAFTWSIPPVKGSRFMLLSYCALLPFCAAGLSSAIASAHRLRRYAAVGICVATAGVYLWGTLSAAAYRSEECAPLPPNVSQAIARALPAGTNVATNNPWVVSYSTDLPTALLPRNLDSQQLAKFVSDQNIGEIVLLGQRPLSATAKSVRTCYASREIGRNARLATVAGRYYGQNAYDGRWKTMPQIVQKLPTTHSPRITPRKNGSARL